MANLMNRFFRSKSCFSPIQRLTPSLITYQKKPFIDSDPASLASPVITISGNESDQSLRFYPSFSMGYFMNSSMVQCPDLAERASLDEKNIVIYADSVKKKRKKKMNKHKYRKLRKRMGRKS